MADIDYPLVKKTEIEDSPFTPTVPSGISATTIETALVEVGTDVEALKAGVYGEISVSENEVATVIRGENQWQALTANVVTGLVNGFTYVEGLLGEIASTSGTGTVATINDVAHGLTVGDIVSINGTTSFNGVYVVNTTPDLDSFTILHDGTTDETGFWQRASILSAGSAGVYDLNWASSGLAAINAHVFDFAPYVNATRIARATARRKFSNADFGSFSGTALVTLEAGDKVGFFVNNNTAAADVTIRSFDLNLSKV
jgi:hypothetical protein